MRIQSFEELSLVREKISKTKAAKQGNIRIIVYGSTCGLASGSKKVLEAVREELKACGGGDVLVLEHGCMGCCFIEPNISIRQEGLGFNVYGYFDGEKAAEVVRNHVVKGEILDKYRIDLTMPFFANQERRITELLGEIDPRSINDYIVHEGYAALAKALGMGSAGVLEEVKAAGLRGRGGAGFPTGRKWEFARNAAGDRKYIVCNADEGDPGAYMNRAELEGNPHAVLEGMIIAGYAIGADRGYIYVRAEYPLAVETLKQAIAQAREYGLLGKNILGSSFDFDV